MNDKITFGIGGIVIGLVLATVFSSSMFPGANMEKNGMMGSNRQNSGNDQMMGGGMMSGSGMHMGGQEDIASLQNATDFDKAFLEAMIPHHQMALMMVQMLESGTERREMIELAKNITVSQSEEIKDMQGWYKEWYGK